MYFSGVAIKTKEITLVLTLVDGIYSQLKKNPKQSYAAIGIFWTNFLMKIWSISGPLLDHFWTITFLHIACTFYSVNFSLSCTDDVLSRKNVILWFYNGNHDVTGCLVVPRSCQDTDNEWKFPSAYVPVYLMPNCRISVLVLCQWTYNTERDIFTKIFMQWSIVFCSRFEKP